MFDYSTVCFEEWFTSLQAMLFSEPLFSIFRLYKMPFIFVLYTNCNIYIHIFFCTIVMIVLSQMYNLCCIIFFIEIIRCLYHDCNLYYFEKLEINPNWIELNWIRSKCECPAPGIPTQSQIACLDWSCIQTLYMGF